MLELLLTEPLPELDGWLPDEPLPEPDEEPPPELGTEPLDKPPPDELPPPDEPFGGKKLLEPELEPSGMRDSFA
jgi:hypothetical protein